MFKSTLLLQAHGKDFEHFPADVEPARTEPGPPACASSRLELLPSPGGTWAAPGPLLRQAASEGTQPADPGIPAHPKGLVPVPWEALAAAGSPLPCHGHAALTVPLWAHSHKAGSQRFLTRVHLVL